MDLTSQGTGKKLFSVEHGGVAGEFSFGVFVGGGHGLTVGGDGGHGLGDDGCPFLEDGFGLSCADALDGDVSAPKGTPEPVLGQSLPS